MRPGTDLWFLVKRHDRKVGTERVAGEMKKDDALSSRRSDIMVPRFG
jgi:hypothetical protein